MVWSSYLSHKQAKVGSIPTPAITIYIFTGYYMGIKSLRRKYNKLSKIENQLRIVSEEFAEIFTEMLGQECEINWCEQDGWGIRIFNYVDPMYPNVPTYAPLTTILDIVEKNGILTEGDIIGNLCL